MFVSSFMSLCELLMQCREPGLDMHIGEDAIFVCTIYGYQIWMVHATSHSTCLPVSFQCDLRSYMYITGTLHGNFQRPCSVVYSGESFDVNLDNKDDKESCAVKTNAHGAFFLNWGAFHS